MKQLWFSIFLSFLCHALTGQNNNAGSLSLIDSLKQELEKASNDWTKAELLRFISAGYTFINPDTAIFYGEQTVKMAEKANNPIAKLYAFGNLADANIYKGNLPAALGLGLKAVEFAKNYPDTMRGVGPSLSNISEVYFQIGNREKALEYSDKMIALGDYNIYGVAFGYYRKAKIYESINQLDSTSHYVDKSLLEFKKVNHDFGSKNNSFSDLYNVRAKVYLMQNKPDLAIRDYQKILEKDIQYGRVIHAVDTYNDIAQFYSFYNKPDSAISYAEKGLEESNKMTYIQGKLNATILLAEKYESIDPVKALYYHKLATTTQNSLYGSGNIQVLRDMIAQDEQRLLEIKAKEEAFQIQLRQYMLMGGMASLLLILFILFRNNRHKQKSNLNLAEQKLALENTLSNLKSAQAQLIQSEKMASLGELTAGIAHEIQNPLNFVNNFSEVSNELVDEMKEEFQNGDREEGFALANDIKQNLEKINHHGKRADAIVKGMLQHSRSSSGQKELTDMNILCDEYLRLAYHGFRAKDKDFNADYQTDFDPGLPNVKVVPQDIGRVLLNLINNAFFAINERQKKEGNDFQPVVSVSTKKGKGQVTIKVSDNGTGIPRDKMDKIFQPFFTTKPTGQGTGLGLSLSYDIIKAHGGELTVESEEGAGASFIITLPLAFTG